VSLSGLCWIFIVPASDATLWDSMLALVGSHCSTYSSSRRTRVAFMISYPYCLLLQVCKTTLSYLLLSLFTIFVCHINLLAVCQHPFWFFLKDFYVGILDAISLCTVMYVRVRSFTFGYPQTLHMRDPH